MRTTRRSVSVESLEDRRLPAFFGLPWPDPGRLSISFAPEGTDIAGESSQLHERLEAWVGDAGSGQLEVLRAFQSWAANAAIDLHLREDGGKPFGEVGPAQGHESFGDLRVGARPLSGTVLALATPYDLASTWSGDVVFDAEDGFGPGGIDLFTVALQEAGHALGLGPQPDRGSALFAGYLGPREGPSAADAARLRELYGPRRPDSFEGPAGNDRAGQAAAIGFVRDASEPASPPGAVRVVEAELTSSGDVDHYSFQTPSEAQDLRIALRTSGVSLLTARVIVLDEQGRELTRGEAADPRAGDLLVSVAAEPNRRYIVRVEGAGNGVFDVGSYRLAVGHEAHEAVHPPEHSGYLEVDEHTNDVPGAATAVVGGPEVADARPDHVTRASVHGEGADVDHYSILAPRASSAGVPISLTATVWALQLGKLDPQITVLDEAGRVLDARVVYDDESTASVRLDGARAGQRYLVAVRASDPDSSFKEGDYFLSIDFAPTRTVAAGVTGVLEGQADQDFQTLEVQRSQLFRFDLALATLPGAPATAVRMTVYDSLLTPLFTLATVAGRPATADVLLAPGEYTVRVVAAARDGGELPFSRYTLGIDDRSDPNGPEPVDTTLAVMGPAALKPPPTPYQWWRRGRDYYAFLRGLVDPYSRPWW